MLIAILVLTQNIICKIQQIISVRMRNLNPNIAKHNKVSNSIATWGYRLLLPIIYEISRFHKVNYLWD